MGAQGYGIDPQRLGEYAKQIKETYETMIFFRRLWDDEYPDKKYDVHPYKLNNEEFASADENNKIYTEFLI